MRGLWFSYGDGEFRYHVNNDGVSLTIEQVRYYGEGPLLKIPGSVPLARDGRIFEVTAVASQALDPWKEFGENGLPEGNRYPVGEAVSIEFGDGIKTIEIAYIGLANENPYEDIESVSLPSSLERIGLPYLNPFLHTSSLREIHVHPGNKTFFAIDGVLYCCTDSGYCLLCYPAGKEDKEYRVREGTSQIASGAFQDNPFIQKVLLPKTLTSIYSDAFKDCGSLAEINTLTNRNIYGFPPRLR